MLTLVAEPLTIDGFKNYGSIVSPDEEVAKLSEASRGANQGTAIKVVKVSANQNLFPSQLGIKASHWNLFRCFPQPHLHRDFLPAQSGEMVIQHGIKVLEKHPHSSQTFIPMGRASKELAYLVVVAVADDHGEPNLSTLRAFTCNGNQAVTYGAGVWHAPMIVLGSQEYLDFSVAIYELGDQTRPEMDLAERFYDEDQIAVKLTAMN
ncbi:LADA_0D03400g1_1 [Lachancea dasiensis]|uniref:Ureidoglycolate lyase n=1 Tax=Lachancea dasiensis TaxID=1072105 RepID=A0A1G4J4Q4_9SACH|nr:LADA_0D03400g1_1 [Lachancea dasiensis]